MSHYGDTTQFCECNTVVVNLKPALKLYECVYLAPLKPEINTDAHEKGIMAAHARVFANFVRLVNRGQTDTYIPGLPIEYNPSLQNPLLQ